MSAGRFDELKAVAGGDVSRETFERLVAFENLFRRWSGRINLAAPSTLDHMWRRHILDSAQLAALAPDARSWVDLGSGGGFPGVVIAVLFGERNDFRIRLVESNRKKAGFLRTAVAETGVAATIDARRIEEVVPDLPAPDIVSARALASLPQLLDLAEPWLAAGSRALFHKGRDYGAEIKQSGDSRNLHLVQHRSVVDSDGVILDIRKMKPNDHLSSERLEQQKVDE